MQLLIAVILGIALGANWGGAFGAIAGAALAWLMVRSLQQARSIADLQRGITELRALRGSTGEPLAATLPTVEARGATGAVPAFKDTEPQPLEERDAPASVAAQRDSLPAAASAAGHVAPLPVRQPITDAMAAAPRARAPLRREPAAGPAPVDPLAAIQRWLFGGNTIVKVGVGILFIGLAFLAKFASEHVHVPIEMRLAAIAGVAIVLLVARLASAPAAPATPRCCRAARSRCST